MDDVEREERKAELEGMPAAVYRALKAHPLAVRDVQTHEVVCAGADCDWTKPHGKNGKKAFLSHQTWAVQLAVADWYFYED